VSKKTEETAPSLRFDHDVESHDEPRLPTNSNYGGVPGERESEDMNVTRRLQLHLCSVADLDAESQARLLRLDQTSSSSKRKAKDWAWPLDARTAPLPRPARNARTGTTWNGEYEGGMTRD
jgi:hypothetical protein